MNEWQPHAVEDELLAVATAAPGQNPTPYSLCVLSRDSGDSGKEKNDRSVERNEEVAAMYIQQQLGGIVPQRMEAVHLTNHSSLDQLPVSFSNTRNNSKKLFLDLVLNDPDQKKTIVCRGVDICVVLQHWLDFFTELNTAYEYPLANDINIAFAIESSDGNKRLTVLSKTWPLATLLAGVQGTLQPQLAELVYIRKRWQEIERERLNLITATRSYRAVAKKRNGPAGVEHEDSEAEKPSRKRLKAQPYGTKERWT